MSRISRRGLLLGSLGGVAGLGLAAAAVPSRARAAETYDYSSRADFDRFLAEFEASGLTGQPYDDNETGALAWGQAYVLLGLVRMYEATHDRRYLDHLVKNIDIVLDQRDRVRGVADYRGVSGPVWQASGNYTAATATLADAAGGPLLQVRSAQSSVADGATAEVLAGSTPGTFTLVLHPTRGTASTFTDVDLDPAGAAYVVDRVYAAYDWNTRWSLRDLRVDPSATGAVPVTGSTRLSPQPYVFAVHTGQLAYPIASVVRIVRRTPALAHRPWYRARANAYLEAVDDAIAFHEREWSVDSAGRGSYRWLKETPVPLDGSNVPLNQSNMLGAASAELYRATGARTYRDRVATLVADMRYSLTSSGGAYSWPYWPKNSGGYAGWAATGSPETDVSSYTQKIYASRQPDDVSHGALSLEFMTAAYRAGIGFDVTDMRQLAATYTHNIAINGTPPDAHYNIDGTGAGNDVMRDQIGRWMPVARWDPAVFPHALSVVQRQALQPDNGPAVGNFAYCVWGATMFG